MHLILRSFFAHLPPLSFLTAASILRRFSLSRCVCCFDSFVTYPVISVLFAQTEFYLFTTEKINMIVFNDFNTIPVSSYVCHNMVRPIYGVKLLLLPYIHDNLFTTIHGIATIKYHILVTTIATHLII